MFAFSANVLQRFVYFRALKTVIPSNLDALFKILGSSWGVKTGTTDYSKTGKGYKRTTMDKLFGVEEEDQDPPIKFREMKYTDIYVKSALPIFLINFTIYIVVLMLIMCNKMLKQSELDRLKRLAGSTGDKKASKDTINKVEMSKCKRAISKTLEFAELHFRWNGLIRTNLLIYQNFTLGLFLNIRRGWDVTAKPVIKVSYILSWISLLFVYCNGYIFYHVVEKYTKKHQDKEMEIEEPISKKKIKRKDSTQEDDVVDLDSSKINLKSSNNRTMRNRKRNMGASNKVSRMLKVSKNGKKKNLKIANKPNAK